MEGPRPAWRLPPGNPATTGKCILIVEDNPLNMKLFSAMVAAQGCHVLQAEEGLRGLDLAHQEHPDLIIMDVQLPGMSGIEVTHALKSDPETQDIPIIVTTAYGYDEEIRTSGCDAFMAKPIAISEFLEIVETLLTRSAETRQYSA
jgi:two-component system, cell cycle response regulator DivK